MNIEKYITNKDIQVKNEDFDIEKMTSDLRKGFIEEKEVDSKVKIETAKITKESTDKYAELERKYNDLEKRNTDLTEKNQTLAQERIMVGLGFKEDNFNEVIKIRKSLFEDEKDDVKAFEKVAERFKPTFFPESIDKKPAVPNEAGLQSPNKPEKPKDIVITRKTRLRDLMKR